MFPPKRQRPLCVLLSPVQVTPVKVEIAQVHVRDGGLDGVLPLGPDLQPAVTGSQRRGTYTLRPPGKKWRRQAGIHHRGYVTHWLAVRSGALRLLHALAWAFPDNRDHVLYCTDADLQATAMQSALTYRLGMKARSACGAMQPSCLPEALLVHFLRLCKIASVTELQGLIVEIDASREIRTHRSLA